jgi:hypothetical protein
MDKIEKRVFGLFMSELFGCHHNIPVTQKTKDRIKNMNQIIKNGNNNIQA